MPAYRVGDTCRKGHQLTEETLFVSETGNCNGCRVCRRLYNSAYKEKNLDRILDKQSAWSRLNRQKSRASARRSHLKINFNLTEDQFDTLVKKQDNKCAICDSSPSMLSDKKGRKRDNLSIDHDHMTGKVRGLLCTTCNAGLGLFKERVDLVQKAAIYLENNKEETWQS